MSDEFKVHRLNDQGLAKADELAKHFAELLARVEALVPPGRERAIVTTKLQEASYFAKMGLAMQKGYQVDE